MLIVAALIGTIVALAKYGSPGLVIPIPILSDELFILFQISINLTLKSQRRYLGKTFNCYGLYWYKK